MEQTEGENIVRVKRDKPTFPDADLGKPIQLGDYMNYVREDDCFGRAWEAKSEDCAICADCDICSIIVADKQSKMVKEKEAKEVFLDMMDFDAVADELMIWLALGEKPIAELFEKVKLMAKTDDDETVALWIKGFVKSQPKVSVKKGIVKLK